jgi:hypothetical protein
MNLGRQSITNGTTKIIFPYNAIDLGDDEMFIEWMESGEPTADVFSVEDAADVTLLVKTVSESKNIQTGVVAGSADLTGQPAVVSTLDVTPEPLTDAFITGFQFTIGETDYVASITGDEIAVELPFETDLSDLDPIVTISNRATIVQVVEEDEEEVEIPLATEEVDFTNPVTLLVTAQDGETETEYTVTVTAAAE